MATTVEALAAQLPGARTIGDPTLRIDGARPLEKAGPHDIAFVANEANLRKLKHCTAGAVLVSESLSDSLDAGEKPAAVIFVDDAKAAFIEVLKQLFPPPARPSIGISPYATVSATAQIGANTNIYPGAYVADNVVLGAGCDVYPGVYIGSGCRLGDRVTLHPGVVLYPRVLIGNRVTIHASAVAGADGFGYQLVDGRHQKIPHFGTVRIEDDVEIGACTTIDRAMIGETVIGEGTKLDNLIMIAHNCELGKHNIFVGQVGLAGSVTTGNYVVCAGHVGVADHVHLGEGCVLGSKSGVHKDIPPGETYIGTPAQPAAEAMKIVMAQRKLPEMRKQLRDLEAKVAELTAQLKTMSTSDSSRPDVAA